MTRAAAVASAMLVATVVVSAQAPKTDASLSKIAADFGAAVTANNAAKVATFYASDATFMPPNEPAVRGRANIQAWFQKQIDQGATTLRLTPTESRISGDLAFEAGTYTFGMKPKSGQSMTDTGKYIVVLKKEGADWKISHDIFNSDMPPPAK
jgi:uncharacterized protein (TIGR02246 family)